MSKIFWTLHHVCAPFIYIKLYGAKSLILHWHLCAWGQSVTITSTPGRLNRLHIRLTKRPILNEHPHSPAWPPPPPSLPLDGAMNRTLPLIPSRHAALLPAPPLSRHVVGVKAWGVTDKLGPKSVTIHPLRRWVLTSVGTRLSDLSVICPSVFKLSPPGALRASKCGELGDAEAAASLSAACLLPLVVSVFRSRQLSGLC